MRLCASRPGWVRALPCVTLCRLSHLATHPPCHPPTKHHPSPVASALAPSTCSRMRSLLEAPLMQQNTAPQCALPSTACAPALR